MKNDFNKKNSHASRGYAGYVTTYDGRREYLRSSLEYIFFRYIDYLSEKHSHINYAIEEFYSEYRIDEKAYRPDFSIYKNGVLRYLIEIKSNKKVATEYEEKYTSFFEEKEIVYLVFYSDKFFNKIKKKLNLYADIEEFKANTKYDYRGKNNPRFGITASDSTKEKIGRKTVERFKDEEFTKKHRDAVTKKMSNPETRQKISRARKRNEASKRAKKNKMDPFIEKPCEICGNIVSKRTSEFQKRGFATCSSSCTQKYKHKHNLLSPNKRTVEQIHEQMKIVLMNAYTKVIKSLCVFDVHKAKELGIISKNSVCSLNSMLKYFNFTEEEILNGKISFEKN